MKRTSFCQSYHQYLKVESSQVDGELVSNCLIEVGQLDIDFRLSSDCERHNGNIDDVLTVANERTN